MFELVDNEMPAEIRWTRTLVRFVVHGEPTSKGTALSERGRLQVEELARSRLITSANVIISSKEEVSHVTAEILSRELGSTIETMSCLEDVHSLRQPDKTSFEEVVRFWSNKRESDSEGESLKEVMERLMRCIASAVGRYRGGMLVIVLSPALFVIVLHLVNGGRPSMNEWLETGFATCATCEYTRHGWHMVMSPENSFLTESTTVMDMIPPEWRARLKE